MLTQNDPGTVRWLLCFLSVVSRLSRTQAGRQAGESKARELASELRCVPGFTFIILRAHDLVVIPLSVCCWLSLAGLTD